MPLTVERSVSRPQGNSISYSQLAHDCDLALWWHRQRIARSGIGIFVIYGSAIHRGIEAHNKGEARTAKEAVRAAVSFLDREINSPTRKKFPLTWDDPPERNKDGAISKARGNYGRLWCREAAVYWLERQIPAYIRRYGSEIKILRTEHQIFVPLTQNPKWTFSWSFEAKLDLECKGDLIADLKTTGEPWENPDKYLLQAHLYMGAYLMHYEKVPTFKFLVMPRVYGSDNIQEWEIPFDVDKIQRYIDGVVRRKVDQIEAGIFPAKPSSHSCNSKYCAWHYHCQFGTGTNLV
jgi:PD-(D/E)XK nuclease superfamily protein